MTKRQPGGTPVGGQFAEDRKPEGGDLAHRSTAQKIAARLTVGTRVLCVENTFIPNSSGVILEIQKSGAKSFVGIVVDPADRERLRVGSSFDLSIGTGAVLDEVNNQFSSNIVINKEVKGRSTWEFLPDATDAEFDDDAQQDESVPEETKQRYIDGIKAGYADLAAMIPSLDVSRYLPNDKGLKLIHESSLTITNEMEISTGIAWTAILKMDGRTINVENDGRGGSNKYWVADGPHGWQLEAALNEEVKAGFPGLADDQEQIDDFCSILDMAHGRE